MDRFEMEEQTTSRLTRTASCKLWLIYLVKNYVLSTCVYNINNLIFRMLLKNFSVLSNWPNASWQDRINFNWWLELWTCYEPAAPIAFLPLDVPDLISNSRAISSAAWAKGPGLRLKSDVASGSRNTAYARLICR